MVISYVSHQGGSAKTDIVIGEVVGCMYTREVTCLMSLHELEEGHFAWSTAQQRDP